MRTSDFSNQHTDKNMKASIWAVSANGQHYCRGIVTALNVEEVALKFRRQCRGMKILSICNEAGKELEIPPPVVRKRGVRKRVRASRGRAKL
jgi:hypothetical protein